MRIQRRGGDPRSFTKKKRRGGRAGNYLIYVISRVGERKKKKEIIKEEYERGEMSLSAIRFTFGKKKRKKKKEDGSSSIVNIIVREKKE